MTGSLPSARLTVPWLRTGRSHLSSKEYTEKRSLRQEMALP